MIALRHLSASLAIAIILSLGGDEASQAKPTGSPKTSLDDLIIAIQSKATGVANSAGMKSSYREFLADNHLPNDTVRYSDFVTARLLFEATRDAGFWNLHWEITNKPPNSDEIWRQWQAAKTPSAIKSSATAECDELSALYGFFMRRAGIHGVGLFWPAPNHTVAVWILHPPGGTPVRVVVPTTQIFLSETDMFGTKKFNPWTQKTIYEYTRRDAPDSYVFPEPLYNFFLQQIDKYAGASDLTLQKLRYLRDGVFNRIMSPSAAAQEALQLKTSMTKLAPEDLKALQAFVDDMRAAR